MSKSRQKREKIVKKIRKFASFVALIFVIVAAILNYTGILSYDEMMVSFGLNEHLITDAELSVHFIDVGQGDSILIISGDKTVLIDTGEAEYAIDVSSYLKSQNISKLDYIVATHPHSDHIGGLADIVTEFDVSNIIVPDIKEDKIPLSVVYIDFINAVENKDLSLTTAVPGDIYNLGISELKILGPCGTVYDDLNDYSVVTELIHGENTFIFTGDAEKISEQEMLDRNMIEDIDVLKLGHHGSYSSSSREFLEKANPEYAVIMCGAGNSYNHPSESTMERITEITNHIYRTDLQGNIIAESDGKNINFIANR